jgi:hypothetical protein
VRPEARTGAHTLGDFVASPTLVLLSALAIGVGVAGALLALTPVVDGHGRPVSLISLTDMLRARARVVEEEQRRERVLAVGQLLPRPGRRAAS